MNPLLKNAVVSIQLGLSGLAPAAMISCGRSSKSCAMSRTAYHLARRILWTMICRAGDRRTAVGMG
jgi:hypothetical protein